MVTDILIPKIRKPRKRITRLASMTFLIFTLSQRIPVIRDEIIEKILDEGGDVEFVSEKIMGHYNHIALIITSKKNNLYENNYPGD